MPRERGVGVVGAEEELALAQDGAELLFGAVKLARLSQRERVVVPRDQRRAVV